MALKIEAINRELTPTPHVNSPMESRQLYIQTLHVIFYPPCDHVQILICLEENHATNSTHGFPLEVEDDLSITTYVLYEEKWSCLRSFSLSSLKAFMTRTYFQRKN